MPDPRLLTLTPSGDGRMYVHPKTREQHVSSTTVLKTLSKELSAWAAGGAAGQAWDNRYWLLTVTRQQAVDALRGWPYRSRDERGDSGTLVHRGAELLALNHAGYPLTPDQQRELVPLLDGSQGTVVQQSVFRWAEWVANYVAEWLYLEQTVWGNGYAGTFDAIVRLKDGRVALVDYKTPKALYRETVLQLASYRYAPIMLNADGVETPMPEIDLAAVVHLPEAGGYDFRDMTPELDKADGGWPDAFERFENLIDHWHWQERVPLHPGRPIPIAAAPEEPGRQLCGARKPGGSSGRPGSIECIEEEGHLERDWPHHGKSSTGSRNYWWDKDGNPVKAPKNVPEDSSGATPEQPPAPDATEQSPGSVVAPAEPAQPAVAQPPGPSPAPSDPIEVARDAVASGAYAIAQGLERTFPEQYVASVVPLHPALPADPYGTLIEAGPLPRVQPAADELEQTERAFSAQISDLFLEPGQQPS
jgi:hypothetical protein